MINKSQYMTLIKEFNKSGTIKMSSLKAGVSRKTGSKYIKSGKSPNETKKPHMWRTRKDPFEDVIEDVYEMLENAEELKATTIFMNLQNKYPGKFSDGQIRTLERRIKAWHVENGKEKILSIPQSHTPGRLMELDWTCMNKLNITIGGEVFEHRLCHAIFTYSNWNWAVIAHSENFESLKQGFQAAVQRFGAVPEILQTDNSSTATHQIEKGKKARTFNESYCSFLEHYDVKPRAINVNSPDENGDIESANGHLKSRINQYLLLRESRDFATIDEYREFLEDILIKGNQGKIEKVKEELKVMRDLPVIPLPVYTETESRVSSFGTIRVKNSVYSMPSRLKGNKVRTRIYDDKIEVYFNAKHLLTVPRVIGKNHLIDYRHVIETFKRKPGAFANYLYKEQMYPNSTFRDAYEVLQKHFEERRADKEYIEILHLAAHNGEEKVTDILKELISEEKSFTMDIVKRKLNVTQDVPELNRPAPSCSSYDKFLTQDKGDSNVDRFISNIIAKII